MMWVGFAWSPRTSSTPNNELHLTAAASRFSEFNVSPAAAAGELKRSANVRLLFDLSQGETWMQRALLMSLFTLLFISLTPASTAEVNPVAAIEKLGGTVKTNETVAGMPVMSVSLQGCSIRDVDLAHLAAFSELEHLDLGFTNVTDAGLVHLKGLKKLRAVVLNRTKVTDAGLVHLKDAKRLLHLFLYGTKVKDAGLAGLKEFKELETLILSETLVTDAGLAHLQAVSGLKVLGIVDTKTTEKGVAALQKALPKVGILK